jgi:hypothetical protein
MWSIQRRDLPKIADVNAVAISLVSEIDYDVRQWKALRANGAEQRFLKAIGLALYAIQQNAARILSVEPARFENMAGRVIRTFTRVRGRKELVPRTADRLQLLQSPYRRVANYGFA